MKKNIKKVTSVFLGILLIISTFSAIGVFATNTTNIIISNNTVYLNPGDVSGSWEAWSTNDSLEGYWVYPTNAGDGKTLKFEGVSSNVIFVNTSGGWEGRVGQSTNEYATAGSVFTITGSGEGMNEFSETYTEYYGDWTPFDGGETEPETQPETQVPTTEPITNPEDVTNPPIQISDWKYNVLSNDTAEITGYNGLSSALTIPREINGYKISRIGTKAFYSCTGLKKINIPDSVKSIGYYAFCKCTELTNVEIPNSVTNIEYCAFAECTGITNIEIPNSVTNIEYKAFAGCTGLTIITIPNNIKNIGEDAFGGCSNLYRVNIDSLFSWCNIDFENKYSNPIYNGADLYVAGELVSDTVTIPNEITKLNYTFAGYQRLKTIEMPNSVISVNGAFYNCKRLENISFSKNLEKIVNSSFYNCEKLTEINLPECLKTIGEEAFGKTGLLSINIPNNVETIDYSAFYRSKISNLIIPDSVKTIGGYAFGECENLTSITIGIGLKSIGEEAFSKCNNLKNIYIKDLKKWCEIDFIVNGSIPALIAINFYINGKLTNNLRIPDDTKTINKYAFYNLRFKNVYIPKSVEKIGENAFNASQNIYIDNPDCYINWNSNTLGGTLYGKSKSTTGEYAKEFNKEFVEIEDFDCESNKHLMITIDENPATCTKDGHIDSDCLICCNAAEHTEIKATGHHYIIYGEQNASCLYNGYKDYYCDKCGGRYRETFDKIAHNYINGYCTMCGERDPSYPTEVTQPTTIEPTDNPTVASITALTSEATTPVTDETEETVVTSKVFSYIPSSEQALAGYNYKLSVQDKKGNTTIYDLIPSSEFVNRVRIYKAEVPANYDISILYYQVYDGDNWISQISVSPKEAENSIINSEGQVVVMESETITEYTSEVFEPTTKEQPTTEPLTIEPTVKKPTVAPTQEQPTTESTSIEPIEELPTVEPNTEPISTEPTEEQPTTEPFTEPFSVEPTENNTTVEPNTIEPTEDQPTIEPTTETPTVEPTTEAPTVAPISEPVIVTEPKEPTTVKPVVPTVIKKPNPIKITVKTKKVKAKKLKKKAQKIKAITVNNAQGTVTFNLIKSGITKKILKLVKINSKGVITIKKWKKVKKGTYKIKVRISAKGNTNYKSKTVPKMIKIKIK